jgi:hypothetical protein
VFQDESVETVPGFRSGVSRDRSGQSSELTSKSIVDFDRSVEIASAKVRRVIPDAVIQTEELERSVLLGEGLEVEIQNPESSRLRNL